MKDSSQANFRIYSAFVLFFLFCSLTAAQNSVTVGKTDPGFVDYQSFRLSSESDITIEGKTAGFERWGNRTYFYGWILESKTRNVVWHLLDDREIRNRLEDGEMFDFNDIISLPPGNYEVYFTGAYSSFDDGIKNLGDLFKKIFGNDAQEYRRRYRNDLYMTVSGEEGKFVKLEPDQTVDELTETAVASIIRVGNEASKTVQFGLKDETNLNLYAIGEGRGSRVYDYAWIYDASNYKRIWQMDVRHSDYAGGADKNIMFDEDITLPGGNYILHYVTDGSHSFDEWNAMPPDDPQFWGVTLWAASDEDKNNIMQFDEGAVAKPVVELTKVEDDAFVYQGFELDKDMKVRILAFGEGYSKRDLSDYGWIVNAETGSKVWDMHDGDIQYAGGAEKNRMVDEVINLDKGKYIAYYQTDGSHSYRDWNAAPPFDPDRYGMTIWTADNADRNSAKLFDPDDYDNENIIAQLVRMRDDEHESVSFNLDKTTKVRIIAIGEGSNGDMFDYGWIENSDNRDIIWEMTYRKTEDAGGANKNRKFDGTILLPAGNYKLYYETDGSHSFRDWNDNPPYNQEMYGITLLREED